MVLLPVSFSQPSLILSNITPKSIYASVFTIFALHAISRIPAVSPMDCVIDIPSEHDLYQQCLDDCNQQHVQESQDWLWCTMECLSDSAQRIRDLCLDACNQQHVPDSAGWQWCKANCSSDWQARIDDGLNEMLRKQGFEVERPAAWKIRCIIS